MDRSTPHPAATAPPRPHGRRPRAGFTLTEMLVVITIIAMLAALTTVGVLRALDTAKQTRMKVEVDGLDGAFKAYKEKYGAYPPSNLSDTAAVKAHIARVFPRYNLSNLTNDLNACGIDPNNFRPDQALVFWLSGFGPDPTNPFLNNPGTTNRHRVVNGTADSATTEVTPLFSFDPSRLLTTATAAPAAPAYFPAGVSVTSSTVMNVPYPVWASGGAPYLYWSAGNVTVNRTPLITTTASTFGTSHASSMNTDAQPNKFNQTPNPYPGSGIAVPYWLDVQNLGKPDPTENWANIDTFQIIAAGMDGKYGPAMRSLNAPLYPTGTNYLIEDNDNVTNFNVKARLEDAIP